MFASEIQRPMSVEIFVVEFLEEFLVGVLCLFSILEDDLCEFEQ